MYWGVDNPVNINAGRHGSVRVTTRNALVKKGSQPGVFLIRPNGKSNAPVVLTLSKGAWKQKFVFPVTDLALYPEISVDGAGEHGVITHMENTSRIHVFHKPGDIDIQYRIDSFRVEVHDSAGMHTRMNIGPKWEDATKEMFAAMRRPARVLIYNVYLTMPSGRRLKTATFRELYFSQP